MLIASQFDAVTAASEGCDALVATGMMPAAAGARSVAEKLGIRSVSATFQQLTLPSPHHPPLAYPGRPFPPEVTDNRMLWDLDAQSINALFGAALNTNRASIGLPPVDNVRDYVIGDHPWLATDPTLDPWQPTDLDVVQTGAWILPDVRPLPDDLEAFLDAGTPPVYAGFGNMPMRTSTDVAQVAIEAIRAQGRRALVSRGWADLALIDDRDDCFGVGEVNQQALFGRVAAVVHHGGAGTTAARAPRRRGHHDDGHPGTNDRRGQHDPHRRSNGGRDAAARHDQPRKAIHARVNHAGSSNQGKCPAPGCTANSACSNRPAYSAAFRSDSLTSYSPVSNSTGFQDHSVRSS
ncbi:MAG: glycosyltransferase [Pseudonocardiaceae bacterium]